LRELMNRPLDLDSVADDARFSHMVHGDAEWLVGQ
jgi:hypothetical protein